MTSTDAVYEWSPGPVSDDGFVDANLAHLVAGNRGRMRDPRRTPVEVTEVKPKTGSFVVRVCAFEDAGAEWELPLYGISAFQFPVGAPRAGEHDLATLRRGRERFDRDLTVDAEPGTRQATLASIAHRREDVASWLAARGPQADIAARIESREGDPSLYELAEEFFAERGLGELESCFSATFVSNPASGEVVKGHAIVAAELGLCPFRGKVARDPALFSGSWSRGRRGEHLTWRLALVQELWRSFGGEGLACYRGTASETPIEGGTKGSFVSATMSRAVAQAHFDGGPTTGFGAMWRQTLPLERLFMSFLETRAMNTKFREAEVVLIGDPANTVF
ncbi:MAG TPA: hypothetical protein VME20_05830 [Acidimicrobiales bacterium]|nr:hypothetical protein [Acidimicrobiales bacterium]